MTPYDRVVQALKAKGSNHKGNNWQCPAHDDRTPSLSVSAGADLETGVPLVLLNCHAGCSTIGEILPALGIEPSELFSDGLRAGVQTELFPASRYSPVGLEILQKLPAGAERSFIVASALGRYVSSSGGRERVFSQRRIGAVIVESKHREAVRSVLGISAGTLRNDVMDWRSWGVAHKCSRTVLTIFIREVAACPVCKASLDGDVLPPKASLPGDVLPPPMSLDGDGFERESVITTPGFFKELGAAREPTELERTRRFEPYEEVKALEDAHRRRKAVND